MQIFIQLIDFEAWIVVLDDLNAPTKVVDGKEFPLKWEEMTEVDRQKVQCDLKPKNIIISALPFNELFRISKCKSAKEIWETLQSTHEEELKSSLKKSLESEKKKGHKLAETSLTLKFVRKAVLKLISVCF